MLTWIITKKKALTYQNENKFLPTFILRARFRPLAKKPPKGPIIEAKSAIIIEWRINGRKRNTGSIFRIYIIEAIDFGALNSLNLTINF